MSTPADGLEWFATTARRRDTSNGNVDPPLSVPSMEWLTTVRMNVGQEKDTAAHQEIIGEEIGQGQGPDPGTTILGIRQTEDSRAKIFKRARSYRCRDSSSSTSHKPVEHDTSVANE